ncbi:MAG: hypothetical protein NZ700_10240, partial [Gemmataceae bacterium]|nr:hypothetical protein [Gemmataceae bacterium]
MSMTSCIRVVGIGLAALGALRLLHALEPAGEPAGRVVVGKFIGQAGELLRREGPGKPWQIVPANGPVYAGELLVQATTDAIIESKNGAVHLVMSEDLADDSPHFGFESAV